VTAELVGPLRPVFYATGVTEWHDLPRDTMDIRYSACGNHHLACDCREALLAENEGEYRSELARLEKIILAAIKGHSTWESIDGYPDEFGRCKCPACDIARAARVGRAQWTADREAYYKRAYAEQREREAAHWAAYYAAHPELDEPPF